MCWTRARPARQSRHVWRSVLIVSCLLGSHATAGAQRGEGLGEVLDVERDEARCITEGALRRRVAHWLRADAELADIEVKVHAAAEPLTFTVRRRGEIVAERRFDVLPRRCADRVEAVALAVALGLEHAASGGTLATQPAPATGAEGATPSAEAEAEAEAAAEPAATEAATARTPSPPAPAEAGPAASRSDGEAPRVYAHATGAVLIEVMPSAMIALGAGGELQFDRMRFALSAIATTESEHALARGVASSQLFAARPRACLLWIAAGLELEGCAGAVLGAAVARGNGYDDEMRATMAWVAPLLRAGLRYPQTGTLSLRLALEGMVHVVRPRLRVAVDEAEASTAAAGPVGGGVGLELVVAIP
jgi:hypothetical protein